MLSCNCEWLEVLLTEIHRTAVVLAFRKFKMLIGDFPDKERYSDVSWGVEKVDLLMNIILFCIPVDMCVLRMLWCRNGFVYIRDSVRIVLLAM